MGENTLSGRQLFIGNTPIVMPKSFKLESEPEPPKAHWGGNVSWSVDTECEITPDRIIDSLLKQSINDTIDEAYKVGINIAPTRLPHKAKKWYARQTKRNQRGMAQYLHILRTNHKDIGECVVSNVKRTMEAVLI